MSKIDAYEREVLTSFERTLKSVATKAELEKLKAAARATAVKDRRVNIRLSSIDLGDIQVKALEEGVPYQTLIASVLHKFVSGRLVEKAQLIPARPSQENPCAGSRLALIPCRYMVVIEKGPSSYGAFVPDLPGCIAVGETRARALTLIEEAIQLHLEDMSGGLQIPHCRCQTARLSKWLWLLDPFSILSSVGHKRLLIAWHGMIIHEIPIIHMKRKIYIETSVVKEELLEKNMLNDEIVDEVRSYSRCPCRQVWL